MVDSHLEMKKLRRDLARLQALTGLMGCVLLSMVYFNLHLVSVHADSIPDVITAKKFIVVDDLNNPRVIVGQFPLSRTDNTVDMPLNSVMTGLEVFPAPVGGGSSQAAPQLITLGNFTSRQGGTVSSFRMTTDDGSAVATLHVFPNIKSPVPRIGEAIFKLEQTPVSTAGQSFAQMGAQNATAYSTVLAVFRNPLNNAQNVTESASQISGPGGTGQKNCKNLGVCSPTHF